MMKRLKRLWKLSKKDPVKLQALLDMPASVEAALPDADDTEVRGEFFAEGSSADFKQQQNEDSGIAAWLDRIRKL